MFRLFAACSFLGLFFFSRFLDFCVYIVYTRALGMYVKYYAKLLVYNKSVFLC